MSIEYWIDLYITIGICSCITIIYNIVFSDESTYDRNIIRIAIFSILIWPVIGILAFLCIMLDHDKNEKVSIENIEDKKLEENKNELKFISTLQKNWDGYDTNPISLNVITDTYNILKNLLIQPDNIYLTAANSIQLEWNGENGSYLEFDILGNGIIRYLQISPNSMEIKSNNDYVKFIKKYTDQDTIDSEEYDRMNAIVAKFSGTVYRKVIFDTTNKE